jgi:hypothetical protein
MKPEVPKKSRFVENKVQFLEIDWRGPFKKGLPQHLQHKIANDRYRSEQLRILRELAPETSWMIHYEEGEVSDQQLQQYFFDHLKEFILSDQWNSPSKVLLASEIYNEKRVFKLLVPSGSFELTHYFKPSAGLQITPIREEYFSGWKVSRVNVFESHRAGEA